MAKPARNQQSGGKPAPKKGFEVMATGEHLGETKPLMEKPVHADDLDGVIEVLNHHAAIWNTKGREANPEWELDEENRVERDGEFIPCELTAKNMVLIANNGEYTFTGTYWASPAA